MKQVVVVDYDPAWPATFAALRAPVQAALSDIAITVEHVGSTAVPEMAAKPVIDIDVLVRSCDRTEAIDRLSSLGYQHRGDLGIPQREAFRAPRNSPRHHLYLCPPASPAHANHIAVRDHLRANPRDARAYGALKKRLAREFPLDMDRYIEGKTRFLVEILRKQGFTAEALEDIERRNRRAPNRD